MGYITDSVKMYFNVGVMVILMSIFVSGSVAMDISSSEIFIMRLSHLNFTFPAPGVTFRASLLNMPDLPSWLHYSYSPAIHTGFVYGSPPPAAQFLQVEVVALDKHTYETNRQVFDLDVKEQPRKPFEVRFKVTNMNVEELLVGGRFERLLSVLAEELWPDSSSDIVVTSLSAATRSGDRMPLRPDEKEGVYVGYGSSVPFSVALLALEEEVRPLWNRHPCPTYFKKTTYERFFRQKGFALDWCSFRLHNIKTMTSENENGTRIQLDNFSFIGNLGQTVLQRRDEVVVRSYVFDFVYTIVIPLAVMVVLLGLLTLAMCCHRSSMGPVASNFFVDVFGEFPRMPIPQNIPLVAYDHRSKESSRPPLLGGKGQSPHPSTATTTTQADTLPHSATASPASTLARRSVCRNFEDYETLTRPKPPPYHRSCTPALSEL